MKQRKESVNSMTRQWTSPNQNSKKEGQRSTRKEINALIKLLKCFR